MKGKFVWRGWSILGLINTYLGWKYNKLITLFVDIETGEIVSMSLKSADEWDKLNA